MIEVRDDKQRMRYEIFEDGALAGFVQYNMRGGRLLLVHTEIDEAYGGRGIGTKLLEAALADVRERGLYVVPVCPFVERFIERHPEYDVLVDHELFDAFNAERT